MPPFIRQKKANKFHISYSRAQFFWQPLIESRVNTLRTRRNRLSMRGIWNSNLYKLQTARPGWVLLVWRGRTSVQWNMSRSRRTRHRKVRHCGYAREIYSLITSNSYAWVCRTACAVRCKKPPVQDRTGAQPRQHYLLPDTVDVTEGAVFPRLNLTL